MRIRSIAVLAFGFCIVAGAWAADDETLRGLLDKPQFTAMKSQIGKDLADGKRFKEIKADDEKTLMTTLEKMDVRWQHAEDLAHLNPEDRVAMANDQEVVTGIVNKASADSRVVCERIEPVGSHMPQNVCKTAAQRRREQEKSQDAMRDAQDRNLRQSGSGSQ